MKPELQISKVEDINEWLQVCSEEYVASQSISWIIDHVGRLCGELAFVNAQMPVAKQVLNKKKVSEYNTLKISSESQKEYYAPSLAKDYIAAKCEAAQYDYDVCERASRTLTHVLDIMRSVLSALKEEAKINNYAGSVV